VEIEPMSASPGRGRPETARPATSNDGMAELATEWLAARTRAEAAEARFCAAAAEVQALYPPRPPGGLYGPHLYLRDQEAADRWLRQTDAIDAGIGLPDIEEAANRAWGVVERIAKRILALRPSTAQEAAIKFGVLMTAVRDHKNRIDDPERVFAFMADLQHLAGVESAADSLPPKQ
jgi:hypothetical protein